MPTKDVTTPVTRLTWYMDAHSWSHWARGRGTTTIQQVLLNGIHAVSGDSERTKSLRWCTLEKEHRKKNLPRTLLNEAARKRRTHKVTVDAPAGEWTEATSVLSKDRIFPNTKDIVTAIILNSKSWNREETDTTEYGAG